MCACEQSCLAAQCGYAPREGGSLPSIPLLMVLYINSSRSLSDTGLHIELMGMGQHKQQQSVLPRHHVSCQGFAVTFALWHSTLQKREVVEEVFYLVH